MSVAGIKHMTAGVLANTTDNPRKQIPRLKGWRHTNHDAAENGAPLEREPVYYSIPRGDWANIEASRDAASQIRDLFHDPQIRVGVMGDSSSHTELTVSAKWIVTETHNGDVHKPDIPFKEFQKRVPSTKDGTAGSGDNAVTIKDIPVVANKRKHRQQYFGSRYRPVPGGCRNSRGDGKLCTLTAPAFDNSQYVWRHVTAAHCLMNGQSTPADVYQPDQLANSPHIGISHNEVYQSGTDGGDCATINMDSDDGITLKIAGQNGTYDYDIIGSRSDSYLTDMIYYGRQMYVQGWRTGRQSGAVKDTDAAHVYVDVDTENGDSGGTYFDLDNGDAWICGIHNDETNDPEPYKFAYATTAEWAENALNITF